MNCPKCDAEMTKVTHENIEVDRCTKCNGIWFDAMEHERLKRLAGSEQIDVGQMKPVDPAAPKRAVPCPVCHTPMIAMNVLNHPGLQYESCTVCYGAFFDAGEFRAYKGGASGLVARLKGLVGAS